MDRREDQEFDKLFKAALEKEESTLHDGVWESIAKEIHTSSERRLGYVWWYRVAASVALFISLGVSLMTMPLKNAGELASTRALNVDAISNDEVWLGTYSDNRLLDVRGGERTSSGIFSIRNSENSFVSNGDQNGSFDLLAEQTDIPSNSNKVIDKTKKGVLVTDTPNGGLFLTSISAKAIPIVENQRILAMDEEVAFALLNLPLNTSKQFEEDDEKFEPLGSNTKWFAGGNFNSQQTDVFLDTDQSEFYDISQGNYIRKAGGTSIVSSNVENAFSTTINLGHKITDKIELLTGLTYSDWQGEQLAYFDITEVKQTRSVTPAPAGGGGAKIETITNVSNLNDTLHTSFQFQSFEVPVMMRYKIEKQRFSYFVSSGFSTNLSSVFKGDNESTILDGSPRFQKSTAFEPTRINMIVGLGLGYKLNDNLVFRLEPNYRYGVPLKEDPFVRDDFSIWGLGTGLNFYF